MQCNDIQWRRSTDKQPFSAQGPHLPCGTVPAYQTRWNTRGAQGQRPSYTPRLQLKDFLSYALGSVAAVLQEGAGEAGALPVDDQLAPRHLNIKADWRRAKLGKVDTVSLFYRMGTANTCATLIVRLLKVSEIQF